MSALIQNMKQLIIFTGIILTLAACGREFRGISEATSIDEIQDERLNSNYNAAIVTNKQTEHKQGTCRHYHTKKYE